MSTWAILDIILYMWIFIIIIGFFLSIIMIFVMRGQYKHIYLRLDLTSSKAMGYMDKAKEVKENDGTIYWKLMKSKHKINRPPSDALIPLGSGVYFVRAFDLGNMNYKYSPEEIEDKTYRKLKEIEAKIIDQNSKSFYQKVREHLIDIRRRTFIQLMKIKPTPIVIYPAEVYTQEFTKEITKDIIRADERQNAYNQIKKAYEKRLKGWAQWGIPIIVVTALVIMISVMFIFGENLVRPITEMQAVNARTADTNRQTQESLSEMMRYIAIVVEDKQLAESEAGGTVQLLNKTAPN
jgi:phosphate/sulfate permease